MEAGEILVKKGLLDQRQLELARSAQSEGMRLDQAAVGLGLISEEAALKALGDEVHIPYVDLSEEEIDFSLVKTFPPKFIHREGIFPIRQKNGCLVVATSDPFNLYPLDEISAATGRSVVPVLASRAEISKLIKAHLGVGSETIDGLMAAQASENSEEVQLLDQIETDGSELSEMAQEPSVIRLVNEILLEAMMAAKMSSSTSARSRWMAIAD
jgi:general secretion pathway protein E/type IV pilus assembly protein PilB